MVSAAEIDQAVRAGFESILSEGISPDLVRRYACEGGSETNNHWSVRGIYSCCKRNDKVVFESYLSNARNLCVVRVYTQRALKMFYAVRMEAMVTSAFREATQQYLSVIRKKKLLPWQNETDALGGMFSDGDLDLVVNPIPPPISLSDIRCVSE